VGLDDHRQSINQSILLSIKTSKPIFMKTTKNLYRHHHHHHHHHHFLIIFWGSFSQEQAQQQQQQEHVTEQTTTHIEVILRAIFLLFCSPPN
jgi:hypothetical protein